MAILSNLKPKHGSRHRRKRIGFGEGSGHGGSATKGMKGQRSRSGDGKLVGFEGGQTPLLRRIPKRGFNNKTFTTRYQAVNLAALEKHFEAGAQVGPAELAAKGLADAKARVKVLADGGLKKNLMVTAHAFSGSAKAAIEAAGGTWAVIAARPAWRRAQAGSEATASTPSPQRSGEGRRAQAGSAPASPSAKGTGPAEAGALEGGKTQ